MPKKHEVKIDRSTTSFGKPRKKAAHKSRRPGALTTKELGLSHSLPGTFHVPAGVLVVMRERNLTQMQLGELLGLTQGATSRKLLGRVSWSYDDLVCLAEKLKVPLTWLV